MKRHSERGIALVITLLMLSVVTFMAVVFLAVSRRERASVAASADLTDARLMTDAAIARAQSEVISRILATTNVGAFDLLVSTNFYNPAGFRPQAVAVPNPTNVNYWYSDPGPLPNKPTLRKQDLVQNLANLQFDARVPVFVRTNLNRNTANPADWDFRYYLDLNRNGWFEPSGLVVETVGGRNVTNLYAGDPQWIGILEHPDRPHSETNRFIGRYAFLAMPAGKSLDINFIHNAAKRIRQDMTTEGFARHQGVGSWELNLAGFLRDLNTNRWLGATYTPAGNLRSLGLAYEDANLILSNRYGGQLANLASMRSYFAALNNSAADALVRSNIDMYSDKLQTPVALDQPNQPWSGSDSTNAFIDAQEFYAQSAFPFRVVTNLTSASANLASVYDRYSYYRLLSQMGVDSSPALSNTLFQSDFARHATNKFHLHYQPVRNDVREAGIQWDPRLTWDPELPNGTRTTNAVHFFYQVADRLLRASLTTNIVTNAIGRPILTNFMLGAMPVRPGISITNIQISPAAGSATPFWARNNEYTPALHRLLQLAVNIYDATTTRRLGTGTNDYPTVFRPLVMRTETNSVVIAGWAEVINTAPLRNGWIDLNDPTERGSMAAGQLTSFNVYGLPWVIGAKRGYPNFNEFAMATAVQASRKIEMRRVGSGVFLTNQMFVIGISNVFGVEAWNSYTQDFRRPLEMVVANQYRFALSNVVGNTTNLVRSLRGVQTNSVEVTNWPGTGDTTEPQPASFVVPAVTNVIFLTNSAYLSRRPPYFFDATLGSNFEPTLDAPQLGLYMTNRVRYWVVDRSVTPNRVVDFVNIDGLVTFMDITRGLSPNTNSAAAVLGDVSAASATEQMWFTNRLGTGPTAPTLGIVNQINASRNVAEATTIMRAFDPGIRPEQVRAEVEGFNRFLTGASTNLAVQVPITPTKRFFSLRSLQANDPLVHFTVGDLEDRTGVANKFYEPLPPPGRRAATNLIATLGTVNDRYEPWGFTKLTRGERAALEARKYQMSMKDPMMRSSDDWRFPTNKLANIGWLGRVHRGTPWQTLYMKSHLAHADSGALGGARAVNLDEWLAWAGDPGTHPTNDWRLFDLFTVAPNANAVRGLLSVNQTNRAAWSAALSAVQVLTNAPFGLLSEDYIRPASRELIRIVDGVNRTRATFPNGLFQHMGEVLSAPELTVASPYVNYSRLDRLPPNADEVVERIPQQVLSLLKEDEPRIVVYAFGQSLKPAERSIYTSGRFYNICTNYQITGEVVAKTVFRIDDALRRPRVVMESYNILPPE